MKKESRDKRDSFVIMYYVLIEIFISEASSPMTSEVLHLSGYNHPFLRHGTSDMQQDQSNRFL